MTDKSAGRIDVIDAIRGFAIFGILLANIQSWSGYKYLPFERLARLPGYDLDSLFYALHVALVDGKFYAIFSMLFGVGFGLQWARKHDQAATFLPMYRRRMAFLFLFGALHALTWSGDILTLYALLAVVMIALRNLQPRTQLVLGLSLLGLFLVSQIGHLYLGDPGEPVEKIARKTYADMRWDVIIAAFSGTDMAEIFRVNLHNLYWRWVDFLPNGRITRVLGFFMIGCYLARSGFFLDRAHKPWRTLVYFTVGLALTLASMRLGISTGSWAISWTDIGGKTLNVAGQLTMAVGYMCAISWIYSSAVGQTLLHPLTLIGRTAFTSYLGQTAIGIVIFYGFGFGLIATLGLAKLWLLAVFIYAGQVIAASIWLKFCRQGPIEWLWRCLTAGRFSPILRDAT